MMTIDEILVDSQSMIRISFFLTIFATVALWELISPKRELTVQKGTRWLNNIAIVIINSAILRLIFPAGAVGVAAFASSRGWGLLNYFQMQSIWTIGLAVMLLDFIIYLQHVALHHVPILWRLHRVHHADLDYDVTTGTRFHPIEIVLSMCIKLAVIIILGPSVVAVILFEIILNATAMFNHGNIHIPRSIDKVLRWFVVTPDMHRVHHSIEVDETDSNFGFNLPWWDRCFRTYRDQPRGGHQNMVIGLVEFRDPKQADQLPGMLALPFISKPVISKSVTSKSRSVD